MEVVERYCHLRPSSYAKTGLDATVDYPYVDLKLKNTSDYPIFLSTVMVGTELTATMYGYQSPDYDEIELDTEITGTTPMPDAIYEQDDSLKPGEKVLERTGYEGISAIAWRTYYKDGEVVKTEELPSSYYGEVAPIYRVGPEPASTDPKPTPEAEPTPTPEPEPESDPESEPESEPTPEPESTPVPEGSISEDHTSS